VHHTRAIQVVFSYGHAGGRAPRTDLIQDYAGKFGIGVFFQKGAIVLHVLLLAFTS
jgi:hypothetical protein